MAEIHGISHVALKGAPTPEEVSEHIERILNQFEKDTKQKVILVGHGLVNDIEALSLDGVAFIDTTNFRFKSDQQGNIKKLKELAKEHLGITF